MNTTSTATTVGNGTVTRTPDQATYHYGETVELSATADPGWTFAGFTGDVSGTTVTMNGNRTVTATFTQDEYTLTVTTVGNGTVTRTTRTRRRITTAKRLN